MTCVSFAATSFVAAVAAASAGCKRKEERGRRKEEIAYIWSPKYIEIEWPSYLIALAQYVRQRV